AYLAPNGTGTIIANHVTGPLDSPLTIAGTGPPLLAWNDLDTADSGAVYDMALYTNCVTGPGCQAVLSHAINSGTNALVLVAQPTGEVYLGQNTTTTQIFFDAVGTGTGDSKVV